MLSALAMLIFAEMSRKSATMFSLPNDDSESSASYRQLVLNDEVVEDPEGLMDSP